MKKISIIVLILSILIITGCEKEKTSNKVISNGKEVNTSSMEHKHCTRQGSVTDGEADLNYDIYYTGDILNVVKSEEKVTSDNEEVLNTYENAYRSIKSHYVGLEYYDITVTRTDNSVAINMLINYDKLDVDKLSAIEGKTSSVFENKKAKVANWLALAKKVGTKCKIVED